MPYLNLDVDYFDHPKTKRLIGLLGKGAEVLPLKLWAYCGKFHADDGKLSNYSEQEIESIVGWWGKAGELIPAFIKTSFLERIPAGWQVHEWLEHEGHIAAFKKRAQTANAARWSSYKDASRILEESNNAPPTIPNRTNLTNQERKDSLPPDCAERIKGIHEWYSEQMGGDVRLGACEERLWFEWIKAGFEDDDLKRVVKFIRDGINEGERNRGAMKLSNLLQLERFSEDLLISKQEFPARVNGKTPEKSLIEKDMERNLEQVKRDFGKP